MFLSFKTAAFVLGAAAVFGIFFGVVYYSIRSADEHELRMLQYRNEFINGLKKAANRRAKQRHGRPKRNPSPPYIGNFSKRLRKSRFLKSVNTMSAGL